MSASNSSLSVAAVEPPAEHSSITTSDSQFVGSGRLIVCVEVQAKHLN